MNDNKPQKSNCENCKEYSTICRYCRVKGKKVKLADTCDNFKTALGIRGSNDWSMDDGEDKE